MNGSYLPTFYCQVTYVPPRAQFSIGYPYLGSDSLKVHVKILPITRLPTLPMYIILGTSENDTPKTTGSCILSVLYIILAYVASFLFQNQVRSSFLSPSLINSSHSSLQLYEQALCISVGRDVPLPYPSRTTVHSMVRDARPSFPEFMTQDLHGLTTHID